MVCQEPSPRPGLTTAHVPDWVLPVRGVRSWDRYAVDPDDLLALVVGDGDVIGEPTFMSRYHTDCPLVLVSQNRTSIVLATVACAV